jgi:signal transduction histidine kinase
MSDAAGDRRYIEVTSRTTAIALVGANLLTALTVVAVWGDWLAVALLVGVQVALVPFNVLINRRLGRWGVARAELLRTSVNLSGVLVCGVIAGWPFPVWFWMLFVALSFDQFSPRVFWTVLLSFMVVQVAAGLLSGAPWIYAACFAAFALFCSQMSAARLGIIRRMLVRADEDNAALEQAHAEARAAHEQLLEQTRVREQMEVELRQAQKLEAVGRLAAGVAHEINTPVQFVGDSISFVRDASGELLRLIETYRAAQRAIADGGSVEQAAAALAAAEQDADLDYLVEHLPRALTRSLEGVDRIATIVRSMKEFAHPDQKEMSPVDINQAIHSTLTIARGEYKQVAEVETDLAPLPLVSCHAGEVNQALLNLIVNAAHAIEDGQRGGALGRIGVRTRLEGGEVVIAVQDSGIGIPPEIRDRIFDPFFTTKETGRGTGQGLAIVRSVVQKHAGSLTFESELGVGTTFFIRLPVQDRAAGAPAA